MATIPAAGAISNANLTKGQLKTALEDIVASLRQIPGAGQVGLTQTIISGVITPAGGGGIVVVDTEAAAAADDLTNVVTTNYPDGAVLLLLNSHAERTVVLKHAANGAGQMQLDRNADWALDDTAKWILLQRRGADWYEIFRGPQRLTSLTVAQAATFTVNREDLGKTMLCTGTFSVTLASAASLGDGFMVVVANVSTGLVTIDPNGAEVIDGALTLAILPGWRYTLVCTGSAWRTGASYGPQPTENPIMNGLMDIWQRGTSFNLALVGGASAFTADRWAIVSNGNTAVVTVARSTNVPTVAQAGVLFNYSLEVDVTTADTTLDATGYFTVRHSLEGGAWRHFAQRQFTLSFWVMSTKTGLHSVTFKNNNFTRRYLASYTINVADTWEYKTITVTASPSTGVWEYGNRPGMVIQWGLAAGSTYTFSDTHVWKTINGPGAIAVTNGVNCLDSVSNFFRLTGVKMELGSIATPYDVTSFDTEYLRCQRFYQKSFNYATAPVQNAGANTGEWVFPSPVGASALFDQIQIPLCVPMGYVQSATLYNPNAANGQVRNQTLNTDCTGSAVLSGVQENGIGLTGTTPGATAVGNKMGVHWAVSGEI